MLSSENAEASVTTGRMTDHEICKNSASLLISITDPITIANTPPIASKP